jgi:hypothetical protein
MGSLPEQGVTSVAALLERAAPSSSTTARLRALARPVAIALWYALTALLTASDGVVKGAGATANTSVAISTAIASVKRHAVRGIVSNGTSVLTQRHTIPPHAQMNVCTFILRAIFHSIGIRSYVTVACRLLRLGNPLYGHTIRGKKMSAMRSGVLYTGFVVCASCSIAVGGREHDRESRNFENFAALFFARSRGPIG